MSLTWNEKNEVFENTLDIDNVVPSGYRFIDRYTILEQTDDENERKPLSLAQVDLRFEWLHYISTKKYFLIISDVNPQ